MVESSTKDPDSAFIKFTNNCYSKSIIAELDFIFNEFEVKEFDRTNLTPLVYAWHQESYKEQAPAGLQHFSERFILKNGHLGMVTNQVALLVKEIEVVIKEFRDFYQPFNFKYTLQLTKPELKHDYFIKEKPNENEKENEKRIKDN